jgi:hypothetical protein
MSRQNVQASEATMNDFARNLSFGHRMVAAIPIDEIRRCRNCAPSIFCRSMSDMEIYRN